MDKKQIYFVFKIQSTCFCKTNVFIWTFVCIEEKDRSEVECFCFHTYRPSSEILSQIKKEDKIVLFSTQFESRWNAISLTCIFNSPLQLFSKHYKLALHTTHDVVGVNFIHERRDLSLKTLHGNYILLSYLVLVEMTRPLTLVE